MCSHAQNALTDPIKNATRKLNASPVIKLLNKHGVWVGNGCSGPNKPPSRCSAHKLGDSPNAGSERSCRQLPHHACEREAPKIACTSTQLECSELLSSIFRALIRAMLQEIVVPGLRTQQHGFRQRARSRDSHRNGRQAGRASGPSNDAVACNL